MATKEEMMMAVEALKMGLLDQNTIQQGMNLQAQLAEPRSCRSRSPRRS
ncbi:MAG: hypothetical protein ACYTGX_11580 [Planctomycetota bacterium]